MSQQTSPFKVFYWAFPIVLIVCTVYTLSVYNLFEPHHGIFGDMFGGLNALFGALAFIGVISALYQGQRQLQMQSDELKLQREELAAQRKELARTAEAQEKSEKALHRQAEMLSISSTMQVLKDASHLMATTKKVELEGKIRILAHRFLEEMD